MTPEPPETDRGRTSESTSVGPGSAVSGLDPQEVAALRAVGERWRSAVAGRRTWLRALPVDPSLPRFPRNSGARPKRRSGRFVTVGIDRPDDDDGGGGEPPGEAEPHGAVRLRRALLGAPLASSAVANERMRKLIALPILSSDALSSVAYGPEAMLAVLALAGASALGLSLPIAAVIVVMMIAVGASYRQIVRAYPHGGGSYVVARDTLGETPALVAAAGLLVDYLLTVSVSISAGVAAVTSAIPELAPDRVEIGLAVIALLVVGNLRGVRDAGALFSAPTYAFVLAIGLLIVVGLADAAGRDFAREATPAIHPVEGIGLLLVLRAFSSGATAMTGIEAISNAVPAFREPASRNARTTLGVMIGLLVTLFAGLVLVIHLDGVAPVPGETMLSALARRHLGSGPLYVFVQASTALVLLLAANTAFNGFPRLLSLMARNGHAPRFFLRLGDRLVFSNGVFLLAGGAALVYAGFDGKTNALIPLYAVGVFVAFTVSQVGMVVRWRRVRGQGWRAGAATNALGAALSGIVFLVAAVTKFTEGAWVALVLIAALSLLSWRIRLHYAAVRRALALDPLGARSRRQRIVPRRGGQRAVIATDERTVAPDELRHLAVVPVARMDRSSLRALAYAASMGQPVLAIHISPDEQEEERFRGYWEVWGDHLPLHVVRSPYRAVVAPAARYLAALREHQPELTLTVVLPELIVKHPWHAPLHNGTTRRLRQALRHEHGIVVTTVGFHLPS